MASGATVKQMHMMGRDNAAAVNSRQSPPHEGEGGKMTWVLIVWFGFIGDAVSIQKVYGFPSKDACEKAGAELRNQFGNNPYRIGGFVCSEVERPSGSKDGKP